MTQTTMSSLKDLCCSPVLARPLPADESQQVASALRVLADPIRLRLLGLIRSAVDRRATTRDLVASLDVSQPTISHHLGVLFDAGFVRRQREGRETWYSIEPDSFQTIRQLLDPDVG